MTVYGYARVSTPTQSIDRQIRNIEATYPDALIYSESYTGTKMDRPEWTKLIKRLRPGDTLVFDSVSRMSRTAEDGVKVYMDLMNKDVNLVFLKEAYVNTDTFKQAKEKAVSTQIVKTGHKATDTLLASIIEAIDIFMVSMVEQSIIEAFKQSEKEVLDLQQRTKEGIETARLAGKQIGRPTGCGKSFVTKKEKQMIPKIKKMSKDFDGCMSDKEIIETLNISTNTFYKYKRKLKEK